MCPVFTHLKCASKKSDTSIVCRSPEEDNDALRILVVRLPIIRYEPTVWRPSYANRQSLSHGADVLVRLRLQVGARLEMELIPDLALRVSIVALYRRLEARFTRRGVLRHYAER